MAAKPRKKRPPEVIAAEKAAKEARRVARESLKIKRAAERKTARDRAAQVSKTERAERRRYRADIKALEKAGKTIASRVAHESPLARLKRMGALNVWELTAADEIIAAFALSIGSPVSRDADLGIPTVARPDAADQSMAKRCDVLATYQKWRQELTGTVWLSVAVDVLLRERDPRDIDQVRQQRKGTAREVLMAAIRHFAALRGNLPRSARDWKLTIPTGR